MQQHQQEQQDLPEQDEPQPKPIHTVNLDSLQKQTHVWVDRGEVMSCEGGDHASHRVFKIKR